VTTCHKAMK